MGEPDVVKAQRLANESNERNVERTNNMNYWIAHEANDYNLVQQDRQNAWNLEQWHRENAYNDPSAQMERYIKAGINPLWAMSDAPPSEAHQLTSADAKPAEVAKMEAFQMQPEYDPYVAQHINNFVTAARDTVNAFQNAADLNLRQQDIDTRKAAQVSRSSLDRAAAAELGARTTAHELENSWTTATLSSRIRQEDQKLQNLSAQYDKLNADTEEAKAKKLEIEEQTKFFTQSINESINRIRQRDRELDIMQQGVNVQSKAQALADERFTQEIKKWNNDTIMQYLYKFGRTNRFNVDGKAGVSSGFGAPFFGGHFDASVSGGYSTQKLTPADVQKMTECGLEILQRAADNPTPENRRDAQEAASIIDALERYREQKHVVPVDKLFNSSSSSIINDMPLNPHESW